MDGSLKLRCSNNKMTLEMFYLNSTLNFGILPVLVFQLEVYYKADRLLSGLTAQQKGTTARRYSNKTSLPEFSPKLLEQLTGLRSGPILEGDLFRLIGMIAGLGENALFNSEQNPRQEWKNDRRNMIDWFSTRSFIKLRNCFLFSQ